MIVEVAKYLSNIGGSLDRNLYLRPIPGRPGFACVCRKPQYDKQKKKEMAQSKNAQDYATMMREAKRQYRDPALRAVWAKRHVDALQRASMLHPELDAHGKPYVPVRLWDYIRSVIFSSTKQLPPCESV